MSKGGGRGSGSDQLPYAELSVTERAGGSGSAGCMRANNSYTTGGSFREDVAAKAKVKGGLESASSRPSFTLIRPLTPASLTLMLTSRP